MQLWHRSQPWLGSDPCPGTRYAAGQPKGKKKKKKKERKGEKEEGRGKETKGRNFNYVKM